jgi:hypothetical protein
MSGVFTSIAGILPTAGSSYLLSDNFEYANNAAAATAGWNNTGTPTWAYATAPAPLVGSFSLALNGVSNYVDRNFTAASDIWEFIAVNTGALSVDCYPTILRSSGAANQALTIITSTGVFQLNAGGGTVSTGAVYSANTTYYVWLHYVKGTGANAQAEGYISTTTTRPGSPTLSTTTGTSTLDAANVQIFVNGTTTMITDYLRISSSSIGSAPA